MSNLARGSYPIPRPAPIRGWNNEQSIAAMEAGYATVLDNFLPRPRHVELRRGHRRHYTGLNGDVGFLFSYRSADAKHLLSFTSTGRVYRGTAQIRTGLPGAARWAGVNFNGRGILVADDDATPPQSYDGTTLAAGTWDTASANTLDNNKIFAVNVFKRRLFFLTRDDSNLWYGDVDAIQGCLSKFPLATVHPAGGRPIALGTLTVDGGAGVDDRLVIFMASGDALVYEGDNITDINRWALVGIFDFGRLVSSRLLKLGGDLVAITENGYTPVMQYLGAADRAGAAVAAAMSAPIGNAVAEAVREYEDTPGWEIIQHPKGRMVLVHVPSTPPVQHVMDTQTRGWCRFTGLDANCWTEHDGGLYFGADGGIVYEADTGTTDDGAVISGVAQGAYSNFGHLGMKQMSLIRTIMEVGGAASIRVGFGIEYDQAHEMEDYALSGFGAGVLAETQRVGASGYNLAERVEVSSSNAFKWLSTEMVFAAAGQV